MRHFLNFMQASDPLIFVADALDQAHDLRFIFSVGDDLEFRGLVEQFVNGFRQITVVKLQPRCFLRGVVDSLGRVVADRGHIHRGGSFQNLISSSSDGTVFDDRSAAAGR